MPKTRRLATIKATGRQYLVSHIEVGKKYTKVHCWGEVTKFRFPGTHYHGQTKAFIREAVEITEVTANEELLSRLFRQFINGQIADGFEIYGAGSRRPVNCGKRKLRTPNDFIEQAKRAETLGYKEIAEAYLEKAIEAEEAEGNDA